MARLKLLAFIAEKPRRSTDIASFFDHAPRTVTQAIDTLEQTGMLMRLPVPGDRRAKLVEITDAGRGMLEQGMPLYDDIVAQTFGSLTGKELLGLEAAVTQLNRIVDRLEEEAGFRQSRSPARAVESRG